MKHFVSLAAGAALALNLASAPASAMNDREKAALGAIALLGIAALAHNQNHYHEGQEPRGADQTAQFERGYRDGLHNEPYDSRHSSVAYGQGFDAGQKERSNRLAHKTRNVHGTQVPVAAMRACRDEAASSWGVHRRDVHAINAGQEGSDNFYIEVASGHKHVICGTSGAGQVFNLRNGRL